MVRLFLLEPNWKEDEGGDSDLAKLWISLLGQLESVIWSLMTVGGRSEARLWLCTAIAGINSLTCSQQRDLFVKLLKTGLTNRGLASQLLQMLFEKRPSKAESIIAKRSYALEKFFEVINQGRQLLRLIHDEELQEEAKIKDIVSQICKISGVAGRLAPLCNECFKTKTRKAIKLLGLPSWVIHFVLSDKSRNAESWEILFSNSGISFQKYEKYALLQGNGLSEENESELDNNVSIKRKHRKKKKIRKRRKRNFDHDNDDDDFYDSELLDFESSNSHLGLQCRAVSWLLSTDWFSSSWTSVDLPEHLSKFCFSTWMKWAFAK